MHADESQVVILRVRPAVGLDSRLAVAFLPHGGSLPRSVM